MNKWSHLHQRINEHEYSKHHDYCTVNILSPSHKGTEQILFTNQMQMKREEIDDNRQVMERIAEVAANVLYDSLIGQVTFCRIAHSTEQM